MQKLLWLMICFLTLPLLSHANLCQKWSPPQTIGKLPIDIISESSGIVVSRNFPNTVYHHNDSGGGSYFFKSKYDGSQSQKIQILNYSATDFEDIATGPCMQNSSCLFIADIGDNAKVRKQIQILQIQEKEQFQTKIQADKITYLKYPNGAHNAESIIVNEYGDLFLFTKEQDQKNSQPIQIFKINKSKLNDFSDSKNPLTLEKIGEIDLPFLNKEFKAKGQIATGADYSFQKNTFVILTYENAIEFKIDLNQLIPRTQQLIEGQDYRKISFPKFIQQESISYSADEQSILVTTESQKGTVAPIIQMNCELY